MRYNKWVISRVAAGIVLATIVLSSTGADYRSPSTVREATSEPTSSQLQAASNVKASVIIGKTLRTALGERLGTIVDLIINLRSQTALFAIIEGDTVAQGGARVAVPLTALIQSDATGQLTLNGTKAQFDAASRSPVGTWATLVGPNWNRDIDRFYGRPTAPGLLGYEDEKLLARPPVAQSGAMRAPNNQTDVSLMAKINDVVRQAQGGQPGNVQVRLEKGVVTLSGVVPNEAQKKQLETQIKALSGVDRVEDHLITENQ